MTNKTPVFPMPQPRHFSDYGFDRQIHYFQVLEEARKHKKKKQSSRSIDTLHFKLQKPISKDDSKKMRKNRKQRWWKNPLHHLFNWNCTHTDSVVICSAPLYNTESRSMTPNYLTTTRTMTKENLAIPYISLRDLNMVQHHRTSTSPLPIYMVT